ESRRKRGINRDTVEARRTAAQRLRSGALCRLLRKQFGTHICPDNSKCCDSARGASGSGFRRSSHGWNTAAERLREVSNGGHQTVRVEGVQNQSSVRPRVMVRCDAQTATVPDASRRVCAQTRSHATGALQAGSREGLEPKFIGEIVAGKD